MPQLQILCSESGGYSKFTRIKFCSESTLRFRLKRFIIIIFLFPKIWTFKFVLHKRSFVRCLTNFITHMKNACPRLSQVDKSHLHCVFLFQTEMIKSWVTVIAADSIDHVTVTSFVWWKKEMSSGASVFECYFMLVYHFTSFRVDW